MSLGSTWKSIVAWFGTHAASRNLDALRAGADDAELSALSDALGGNIPSELEASLRLHDGGGDFVSYELLRCSEIPNWWEILAVHRANGAEWSPDLVPFAVDSGGNMMCVASDNVVWWVDAPTREAGSIETTLHGWFDDYLHRLESGELEVDEEGFVAEPIVAPSVAGESTLAALPQPLLDEMEAALNADDADAVFELLSRAGLGLDVSLRYGTPLIGAAAMDGREAVLRRLLDEGADVDAGASSGERTALFWACWGPGAKLDLVTLLLDRGADPNAMTSYDGTSLHSATMWGHTSLIAALAAAGADFGATDAQGRTALESTRDEAIASLLRQLEGVPSAG